MLRRGWSALVAVVVLGAVAACEATTVEVVTAVVEPDCELFDESGQVTPQCSGVASCATAIRDARDGVAAAHVVVGQACEALAATLGLANTWEGLPERERIAQACGRARGALEAVSLSCSGCDATVTCTSASSTKAGVLAGVADVAEACCEATEARGEVFEALLLCDLSRPLSADGTGLTATGLCTDCVDQIEAIVEDSHELARGGPCTPFLSAL